MSQSLVLEGNRALVYQLIRRRTTPISAYDVLAGLRDEGVKSPPVVYRALKYLEAHHLIHRIDSQNAYVACAGLHDHATGILLVCDGCGLVTETQDTAMDRALEELAKRYGFTAGHGPFEIKGFCAACKANRI